MPHLRKSKWTPKSITDSQGNPEEISVRGDGGGPTGRRYGDT